MLVNAKLKMGHEALCRGSVGGIQCIRCWLFGFMKRNIALGMDYHKKIIFIKNRIPSEFYDLVTGSGMSLVLRKL